MRRRIVRRQRSLVRIIRIIKSASGIRCQLKSRDLPVSIIHLFAYRGIRIAIRLRSPELTRATGNGRHPSQACQHQYQPAARRSSHESIQHPAILHRSSHPMAPSVFTPGRPTPTPTATAVDARKRCRPAFPSPTSSSRRNLFGNSTAQDRDAGSPGSISPRPNTRATDLAGHNDYDDSIGFDTHADGASEQSDKVTVRAKIGQSRTAGGITLNTPSTPNQQESSPPNAALAAAGSPRPCMAKRCYSSNSRVSLRRNVRPALFYKPASRGQHFEDVWFCVHIEEFVSVG